MLAILLAFALGPQHEIERVVPAGTPIASVQIVRYDVFDTSDPATSAWPYRAANALHVLSRERFIRSLLLFREGDPLDYARLAESARILRATGYLNPVHVTTRATPAGAEVLVETHDQWTTEASISYGKLGGRQHSGVSLSEQNLLGLGKNLVVDYNSDSERRSTTFEYHDPLFFGSRWRFEVAHRTSSDGSADSVKLQYPFFSLATPRAGGITWKRESLDEWLWAGGKKAVSGAIDRHQFMLWGGMRLSGDGDTTDRLTLGAFSERATFRRWEWRDGRSYPAPDDRRLAGFGIGWERQRDRWRVVQGFRSWQRQEDVPLGPNWRVFVGFSLPALGADRTRVRLDLHYATATLIGRQYSWITAQAAGRLERGGAADVVTHVDFGTARTGRIGWRARVAADLGHNLDLDRQLTLGADTGLRGWDPDFFDGTSRVVANVEWRHQLTGEVLHLGVIGLQLFADTGKTWGARVGESTRGWRADAGAGLLIELTRAAILRVVRVEVAYPDTGHGPVFVLTGTSLF